MKKYISLLVILIIGTVAISAQTSSKIVQALANCSEYSESGIVNSEGVNFNSHKQILGMKDDKCVYEEKISFGGYNSTITCSFTQEQRNEIVSVMNAYEIINSYSNDSSELSDVQGNPVVKVWNKYLQNPSVCVIK